MKKFYSLIILLTFAFAANAQYLSKDFADSDINSGGWTTQNVTGAVNWYIYVASGNPCAAIKNWDGTVNNACETWLISPSVDLTASTEPVLTFRNACSYDGAVLQAYVSTDYSGTGLPATATWTELTFDLSAGFFAWANANIDLSAYKTNGVYIAFKYTGSSTDGKTWEVDDIKIDEPTTVELVYATLPHTKDFADNSLTSGGWTNPIVTGTTNWFVAELGGDYFAKITNYSGGANTAAESWLVSPGIKIVGTPSVTMSFRNAYKYEGDPLKLMVSSNYSGEGNPNTATWTDISSDATWSPGEWAFVGSGDITLPSFTNDTIYVAFKYTGSATDGSTWEIDDIQLTGSSNIDENVVENFKVFPNPANETINLEGKTAIQSVQIINIAGEIVYDSFCNSKTWKIDVSNYEAGVYMVKLNLLEGSSITKRVFVE
ncbi:MAG: choice-of-anchor J domain-containing protein [Bacteroidales bacterium]|nr:choice-of-anchor J domain-containing protein [Bacteroidales bacterium]